MPAPRRCGNLPLESITGSGYTVVKILRRIRKDKEPLGSGEIFDSCGPFPKTLHRFRAKLRMTDNMIRPPVILLWVFLSTLFLICFSPKAAASEAPLPGTMLPPLPAEWRNSIRRVQLPEGKKWIAFTFDLCERAKEPSGYDAEVVDTLRRNHAKATFFAGGKWMQSHPEETLQLMADPLFELGTHGWVHENFRLLSTAEAEKRLLRTQYAYETLREELRKRCDSGSTLR